MNNVFFKIYVFFLAYTKIVLMPGFGNDVRFDQAFLVWKFLVIFLIFHIILGVFRVIFLRCYMCFKRVVQFAYVHFKLYFV